MKRVSKVLALSILFFSFVLGLSLFTVDKFVSALPKASSYVDIIPVDPGAGDPTLTTREISTYTQLATFAAEVNAGAYNINAVLKANIDLSGKIWTPIGTPTNYYRGKFDGNGYVIKNMVIDSTVNTFNVGLFGVLGEGAIIRDFVLQNTFIQTSAKNVGPVVGAINGANVVIKNVAVEAGQINASGASITIGAIVGYIYNTTNNITIANSYSNIFIVTPNTSDIYYIGGIYGRKITPNTSRTYLYNNYYTGQITTATSINNISGIGINLQNTYSRNIYYSFPIIRYSGANESKNAIINAAGTLSESITAEELKAQTIIHSNFELSSGTPLDFPAEADDYIPLRSQENWFKNEGQFPELRGVGNKVVAAKNQGSTSDYTLQDNTPVVTYQALNGTTTISLNVKIKESDETLDTYQLFRKVNPSDIISTYENKNRLTNVTQNFSVTPQERQGYYVFEFKRIALLHEQKVYLKDLANFSVNHAPNLSEVQISDSLKGTLSFYTEGELFTGTTLTSRGDKYQKTWKEMELETVSGQDFVKIYTTNNTPITIHAVAKDVSNQVLSYYHSVFLYSNDKSIFYNTTSGIDNTSHSATISNMKENETANLVVCLSDIYQISFNETELFDNSTMEVDYGHESFLQPSGTNILYISRKDGNLFYKNLVGNTAGLFLKPDDQRQYPIPLANGYVFDGWFTSNRVYRFSQSGANAFANNSVATQQQIRNLMTTTTSETIQGKEYKTPVVLTLYGYWNLGYNNVEYASILNLYGDFNGDSIIDPADKDSYNAFWRTLPWNKEKTENVLNNSLVITDVAMQLSVQQGSPIIATNSTQNLHPMQIETTKTINIKKSTMGSGWSLVGILVVGLNGSALQLGDSLKNTPATFLSDYEIGADSLWYSYYDYQNENGLTIYHLHGDVKIFAIYDRGIGEISAKFNLNLPDAVKESVSTGANNIATGFSVAYDIFEIGNTQNAISSGTITQDDWLYENGQVYFEINQLKSGQTIKLSQTTLDDKFIFIEKTTETRITSSTLNKLDADLLGEIAYASETWTISNFIKANTQSLTSDKNIYFDMGIRYKGLSLAIGAANINGETFSVIPSEDFSITLLKTKGSGSQQSNSIQSIENVQANSVLVLQMDDLKKWTPKKVSNIYTVVLANFVTGEIISNHNITLQERNDQYEYSLSNFSAQNIDESQKYIIYILVEQTKYTIEIERKGLPAALEKLNVYNEITKENLVFNSSQKTTLLLITYQQLNSLRFSSMKGYQITDFKVYNMKPDTFVIGSEFLYNFAIGDLSDIAANNNIIISAKVEALKTDYQIEYYKESLNDGNVFELFETQLVSSSVLVGETKTITPSNSKYTGFMVTSHPNEILTSEIIYAENGNITTFKVYYIRKEYTVVYNGNGNTSGSVPNDQIVKYGHTFSVANNESAKTGYTFVSWNTKSNNTGSSYLPSANVVMNELVTTSSALTLYAIWQEKTMQITYISNVVTTAVSSSWNNITGYTTFSDKFYATGIVTYSKPFGFVQNMTYSTLPQPSAIGYDFAGWWTEELAGGTQITAASIVNFTQDTTIYARWTRQSVTIQYEVNVTGVSLTLSFNSKKLYVGDKYSDQDIQTSSNSGFPIDNWTGTKLLNLKGWALEANPSGSISYLTNSNLVPAGQATIKVYAHWEVLAPSIVTESNWSSVVTYNQENQKTLEIKTTTGGTYISNYSSIFTYQYSWFKGTTLLESQTATALYLKNVSDSGSYKVKVTATHAKWGSANAESGMGTVTINPMQLSLVAEKTNGFITKVYDNTTQVKNVSTSNKNILLATAFYDNENVGQNKLVTFTLSYVGTQNPQNYVVYYESSLLSNPDNLSSFQYAVSVGEITKYSLVLAMGNLSSIANGTRYRVESSALTIPEKDSSFLGGNGHTLGGYIQTANATAGVYSTLGVGLLSYLTIKNASLQDKTANYDITVTGQFEIVEGVLKTVVISKTAILDKLIQNSQSVNTPKFIIRYLTNDISSSGVYNISGTYFNVVNEENDSMIMISTNAEFIGSVIITAVSFNHTVASVTTIAMPYRWMENGQNDLLSTNMEYNFASVTAGVVKEITVEYRNFSTIHYFTRFSQEEHSQQTVYNTASGITVSHVSASEVAVSGLDFLGWFDSTSASALQIPTLWKGYGDINVYAKWNVLLPEVQLFDDETLISNSISRVYDALSHNIKLEVSNSSSQLLYKYSWKVNSQEKSTLTTYSYKNVASQTISLTVRAELYFNNVLYQSNTTSKTITLTVSKFEFAYDEIIEKVYDGTTDINASGVNYLIVPVVMGAQTEYLKLSAKYSSKYAANEIPMTNIVFSDYLSYSKDNYLLSFSGTGKITQKTLQNVYVGSAVENQKIYDGKVLQITKNSVVSSDLITGDLLDITFQTISLAAQVYDASAGGLEVVSYTVWDASRSLNITSSYSLQSILGSAKIFSHEILMQDILLENASVIYNGQQRYLQATMNAFENGVVPSDVSIVYSWKKNGEIATYEYPIGPSEVGTYTITMTLLADENNYTIIGANTKSAELVITKKALTIFIQDTTVLGQKGVIIITNEKTNGLVLDHIISGTVETNSNLSGVYSANNLNLVSSLSIQNTLNEEKIGNYAITINGSITIENYYFIEYNANGGSNSMLKQKVNYGEEIFLSTNLFHKDGYEYSHWNTKNDGSGTSYAEREVVVNLAAHNQTVTMYAVWTPSTNTKYYIRHYLQNLDLSYDEVEFSFDTLTGTTENRVVFEPVIVDGKIDHYLVHTYQLTTLINSLPFFKSFEGFSPAVVENKSFLEGTITAQSQGSLVIKLYYERNSYELTLNKNNFDDPSIISQQYLFQQEVQKPANPQRTGYEFIGWFIDFGTENQSLVSFDESFFMPSKNVQLMAIYEAHTNTAFYLEYYEQNVDGTYPSTPSSTLPRSTRTDAHAFVEITKVAEVVTGAVLRVYDDTNKTNQIGSDFVFEISYKGFYLVENASQVLYGVVAGDGTTILKLYFAREIYAFAKEYHSSASTTVSYHYYMEDIAQPATPVYTGYVFDGWYETYSEMDGYQGKITWTIKISQNMTIHAKWLPSQNTKYKVNLFFEPVSGSYLTTPTQTREFTTTTNFYAEIITELYQSKMSNVLVVFDETKVTRKNIETTFDYIGFHINHALSTLSTDILPDGSGEMNIYFERDLYQVTFVYHNGEEDTYSPQMKFEQTISKVTPDPVFTGYVFAEWYLDESYNIPVSWPFQVTNNQTVMHAKWNSATNTAFKIETYKQQATGDYALQPVFETFGGTTGHFVVVEQDYVIDTYVWYLKEYTDSTKTTLIRTIKSIEITGYTFNQNSEVIEKEISPDGLMTIKLYYDLNAYNFIMEPNNEEQVQTQSVLFGTKPTSPSAITYTGYVFVGWFEDATLITLFNLESFSMPAHDVTIYAKWTPAKDTAYQVEYYLQNLDLSYELSPNETANFVGTTNHYISISDNQITTYETPAKTTIIKVEALKTFVGFSKITNANEMLQGSVNRFGTLILKVYLQRNTYSITFNYNSPEEQKTISNILYESVVTENIPLRSGYTFANWYYESTLTTKANWQTNVQNQTMTYQMEAKDVIFFARWSANSNTKFHVEHYLQNANNGNYNLFETKEYEGITDTTAVAQSLVYLGFVYDSENSQNILSGNIAGDGSLVLKVYYNRAIYKLSFNGNGSTLGAMTDVDYKYGQTLNLPMNTFTRNGYTFKGWTDVDGGLIVKNANQSAFTFSKAQNITLYALWQLNAITSAQLTVSAKQNIYYGDETQLQVTSEHDALVNYRYEWYFEGNKLTHNQSSLTITELNQSGSYTVLVIAEGTISKGAQNNVSTLMTNLVSVTVSPRPLVIDFEQLSFVYNAQNQNPSYQINYYVSEDDQIFLPTLPITKPVATFALFQNEDLLLTTMNAGTYTMVVTLEQNDNFVLMGSAQSDYEITKLSWDISGSILAGEFSKDYAYPAAADPTLEKYIKNETTNETVLIDFSRQAGESVGLYDLTLGANASSHINYNIQLASENDGFAIKKVQDGIAKISFATSSLLSKVYDGQPINIATENGFKMENLVLSMGATLTSATFAIKNNSKNVGSYEIILVSATSVEFESVEMMSQYYFVIKQRSVEFVPATISKVYDKTTTYENIQMTNIVAGDEGNLSLQANFTIATVAVNIPLIFTLQGSASSNYKLGDSFTALTGSITPRKVKIVSNETSSYEYGSFDGVESFTAFGLDEVSGIYNLEVDMSQISGLMDFLPSVSKFVVGDYITTLGSIVSTSNYQIEVFESGTVSILPKTVQVVADWNKYYDGLSSFTKEIGLIGVFPTDHVSAIATYQSALVGKLIPIDIALTGDDYQNYVLENPMVYGNIEYRYVTAILDYAFETLSAPAHSALAETTMQFIYNKTIKESGYVSLPTPWATGYEFNGWYDENNIMFTVDTLINSANWQDELSSKTLVAKWSVGTVDLTVNVISQSSSSYVIETMNNNPLASGTLQISGVDYLTGGNKKSIEFGSVATITAIPNSNYEFVGWFLSSAINAPAISTNATFTPDGTLLSVLMNNNITVFAKFKLKTATIVLHANAQTTVAQISGDYLSWQINWIGNGFTTIQNTFDFNTLITLPTSLEITREGYDFVSWSTNETGLDSFSEITLSGDLNLFAIWQAKPYLATFVASTGAEEGSALHADRGHFENPTNVEDNGTWQKEVLFEQTIGLIQQPTRNRYTFAGWYDNPEFSGNEITADTIYNLSQNQTYFAKWIENTYTITLTVEKHMGGQVRVEQSSGILSVIPQITGTKQIITVQLLATATFEVYVSVNKGYTLNYSHSYQAGVDFNEQMNIGSEINVAISRFNQNLSLDMIFLSMLHEITFTIPNTQFGSAQFTVQNVLDSSLRQTAMNDEERVVITNNDNQQTIMVYAYTDEVIAIQILPVLGYELNELSRTSGNGQFGALTNSATTFTAFSENSQATISFKESTHTITVKVGKDVTNNTQNKNMGTFAVAVYDKFGNITVIDDNVNNDVTALNIQIKTGETLIITANAFHGFTLSQNIADYTFNKQAPIYQDGIFNLDEIALGVITFSSFNGGGEILLPYARETFSVNIKVAITENGTYDEITENISSYIETQVNTNYDRFENETAFYHFEKMLTLQAIMSYGYKFVGWFENLDETSMLSANRTYSNYQVTDNMVLYAVFELDTFVVTYSFLGKGRLEAENLTQEIKYQRDGESVVAIADEGHEFSHWEIYNNETLLWETDEVNTQVTRQDMCVTESMSIRAVFSPSQIQININSLFIIGKDANNSNIYADEISEDVGIIQMEDPAFSGLTFTYFTYTEETVRVFAFANQGYSIVGWIISEGSSAVYIANDGLKDISVKNFKHDFTLTAVFDSNVNVFKIAFVKPIGNDYNYNSSQYISGGVITIDPSLFLQTQPYQDKVEAAVRTKQAFEVVFQITRGYNVIVDGGLAKVGIRFQDQNDIVFADNVTITELSGRFQYEVTFTMDNFYQGGEIVLFVEEQVFDVTFYKTEQDYRVFQLKINSTFATIDSDYKLPSRTGYIFEGWFSAPLGQGVQYINANGNTIREWQVEHTMLYAHWSKAFVRYTLQYIPSISVASGPLGWNVQTNELKRVVNAITFEYYVGITTYFQAQSGLEGYIFSHWAKDGQILTTNQTYVFSIREDETNMFQTLQIVYKVRYAATATVGGSAKISGENYMFLLAGETAMLEATPKLGYDFVGWKVQGSNTIISTAVNYEISYNGQATVYVAVFEGKKVEIIILEAANGSVTNWKVNGGLPMNEGGKLFARLNDLITFETAPQVGYMLTGWEINGVTVSKFDYYEIKMADVERTSTTFKPIFVLIEISYEIFFGSSGEVKINNQNIISGKTFSTNYYSNVTFSLNPTIRYEFKQITVNGMVLDSMYISQSGMIFNVTIPSNKLSLTNVNRIQLSFDRLFWQDAKVAFEGLGTAQSPYIISSAEHFAQMAYLINNNIPVDAADKIEYASAYYVMFASIDFEERFWTPIGTEQNPFNGIIRLDYQRKGIFLDATYTVIQYDGLFGYVTENAQFLKEQADITTGIIIFSSVGAALIGIVVLFSITTYQKRKRLREQSRVFPTERPMKKG